MKSVLTASNQIHFTSDLDKFLRFISTHYLEETHKSIETSLDYINRQRSSAV